VTALTGAPRAREYRTLTIHRYHPDEDLGGTFRWLDFDRDRMLRLIDRGYEDACTHKCIPLRCVIPGREEAIASTDTAEWARRDA